MRVNANHVLPTGAIRFLASGLACTIVACGAKLIPYAPQRDVKAAQAMRVVQRTIEQQPGSHVPLAVEVTPIKLTITSRATQILYFDDLWKSDLHSKRSYFIVRFWDNKRHGFRIDVSELRDAKLFIDSLYVLSDEAKILAKLPDEQRALRVRSVERQRKVLELEADEHFDAN
jgi:hypothetical protein